VRCWAYSMSAMSSGQTSREALRRARALGARPRPAGPRRGAPRRRARAPPSRSPTPGPAARGSGGPGEPRPSGWRHDTAAGEPPMTDVVLGILALLVGLLLCFRGSGAMRVLL